MVADRGGEGAQGRIQKFQKGGSELLKVKCTLSTARRPKLNGRGLGVLGLQNPTYSRWPKMHSELSVCIINVKLFFFSYKLCYGIFVLLSVLLLFFFLGGGGEEAEGSGGLQWPPEAKKF